MTSDAGGPRMTSDASDYCSATALTHPIVLQNKHEDGRREISALIAIFVDLGNKLGNVDVLSSRNFLKCGPKFVLETYARRAPSNRYGPFDARREAAPIRVRR